MHAQHGARVPLDITENSTELCKGELPNEVLVDLQLLVHAPVDVRHKSDQLCFVVKLLQLLCHLLSRHVLRILAEGLHSVLRPLEQDAQIAHGDP